MPSNAQLARFLAITLDLADFSEQATPMCQRMYLADDLDERFDLGTKALRFMLSSACAIFSQTAGVYRSVLFIVAEQGLVPLQGVQHGFTDEELSGVALRADETSAAGYCLTTGQAYLAQPAAEDPHFQPIPQVPTPGSVLCVPVLDLSGEPIGVLSVDSERDAGFSPDNEAQLRMIATRVSDVLVALVNAG